MGQFVCEVDLIEVNVLMGCGGYSWTEREREDFKQYNDLIDQDNLEYKISPSPPDSHENRPHCYQHSRVIDRPVSR